MYFSHFFPKFVIAFLPLTMKKLFLTLLTIQCSLINVSAQRWDSLERGVNGAVAGLIVYNGNLIAGGYFDTAGGQPANKIAQWNGSSWSSPFGLGVSGAGTCTSALPIAIYNGNLIIGGAFGSAAGNPSNNIAQWDGASWSNPFGSGLGVAGCGYGSNATLVAMVYNGNLIVGGGFSSANGISVNNIAQWNGTKWDSLGSGVKGIIPSFSYQNVFALDTFQGKLIAGGAFDTAGGLPAKRIAEWDGSIWLPLGSGCIGHPWPGMVEALTVYNGELIVGGYFDTIGGIPANNIAEWNGSTWSNPFGSGTVGGGEVLALTVYKGNLIACGKFDSIDGIAARNIAEWNGSSWSPLGKGINSIGRCLTEYNKLLIVSGDFDTAGRIPANYIASWCDTCPPLAVAELKDKGEELRVYPNPSKGKFAVSITNYELGITNRIEIYNMMGEKVYDAMLKRVQHDNTIDLSGQPAGIYMYRVITETGKPVGEGKLVIMH